MSWDNQYSEDSERLATLVERHAGIAKERLLEFLKEYGAENILPCANILCGTNAQRKKLAALFEFKSLYETVKQAENKKEYVFDGADAAKDYFRSYYADKNDREYFVAAYLNSKHKLIATKLVSAGTLDSATVYQRDIIKEALYSNAKSVIIAHNHPSGATNVSEPDIDTTHRTKKALESVGVDMLDHIIVAGDKTVSLTEMGILSQGRMNTGRTKAASSLSDRSSAYIINGKASVNISDEKPAPPKPIKEQLETAAKQAAEHNARNAQGRAKPAPARGETR